jgi:RHS repeat-associated protein
MICWGNHPLPRVHATKVEYVAVGTARIDYSKSSPEQSDGRAERERASQTDFATAGYYFVYATDGRLYGRYTPVKNQNLSRDAVGRVTGSSQSMSGTSLMNESIAWNTDGTQSGNSITRNGSVSASDSRSYGYNLRGELLLQNFSPSSGLNGSATYQFDGGAAGGLGLRTGVTLGVAMSGVTAQSYGTFGRLGSMSVSGSLTNNSVGTPVSQTYDAAGNVTTRTAGGSTDTLTWDAFGQLVKDVRTGTGAFTWSAIYDGLGRRLQTTQGALTVQSSYDPEVEFLELVTTINGVRNWHVTGPDLDGRYGGLNGCGGVEAVYNQSTSSATYLLSDTYGHTEGTLSGTTFVWNPTQCDGYGALPGTTKPSALVAGANVASQLGWRSHYIDPTGFYYMGARNYAPDSGTFLSPDPLGHSASMDLYSYCDGDPVNQYDSDGRFGKGGFDSAAGIVTGTAGLVYNGVGSAAYGVTSLGGLVPNSVSDIYANQWQGLKNTGSGLAALGGQISSGQFSQVAQELTGGANVSGFYRAGYATVGIASLFAGGEVSNLGKLGKASEVADIAANTSLRFTQVTASPWFSAEGTFAGKTISDVASNLRAGTLKVTDVPVTVVGDGLIVNTRSSLALMQAGIPQSQWSLIQGSAKDASEIASRLSKNGLGTTGTDVIRITGSGKGASTLFGPGTIPQP